MANTKSKKSNKTKKKQHLKFDKSSVAIILIVALIMTYVFYECYSVTHVDLEFVTAVTSQTYKTIDATALAVRDEKIVENESSITVAALNDGDKVKNGGNIAMKFSSSEDAQKYSRLLALRSELDYYLDIESQTAGTATDIESINEEINTDVNDYVRNLASENMAKIDSSSQEMNKSFTRRQLIIGKTIDFSTITQSIQSEISSLGNSSNPSGYVKSNESGVFFSSVDGNESNFDYGTISEVDETSLNEYIKTASKTKAPTNCLGKLVTSYQWYFVCVIDGEEARNIKNGQKLDIAVGSSDRTIKCKVVSGGEPDINQEKSVLVLKCADMDKQIASYRVEDIEIRYDSYDGVKVPSSALHVENGVKGVYALVSNQVEFREVEVLYSTDDYSIVSYDPDNAKGIRLYDQIITQGKDLYDGKVCT